MILNYRKNSDIVSINKNKSKKRCSQMTSFEEVKYFIQHCPNTKMDGDNDGIPCERQFNK